MADLGSQMRMAAFTVQGELSAEKCGTLTNAIIAEIGMTVAYPPKIYDYPHDGKGGVGFTYMQTITESFVVWDAWPEIGGAYLVICSCKPFNIDDVKGMLERAELVVKVPQTLSMRINDAPVI